MPNKLKKSDLIVEKPQIIDVSNMPVSSSLGHLAYGDLAFTAWRMKKLAFNEKKSTDEKK